MSPSSSGRFAAIVDRHDVPSSLHRSARTHDGDDRHHHAACSMMVTIVTMILRQVHRILVVIGRTIMAQWPCAHDRSRRAAFVPIVDAVVDDGHERTHPNHRIVIIYHRRVAPEHNSLPFGLLKKTVCKVANF